MDSFKKSHEKALSAVDKIYGTPPEPAPDDEEIILTWLRAMDAEGWRLMPKEITPAMCAEGRKAFREAGLLPAYTDEGGPSQAPIMTHMLQQAWPKIYAAAPKLEED